ncbi:M23 family metallopeptidase [Actinoplanes sp. NPDC051475]|uniref:M23 family metallopeptidase n=1 Tax=Actinoplanes sp. NPDC051475 TaxID=3157225 RepID=UPI00344E1B07
MSSRLLLWIAAAVIGFILLCAAGAGVLTGGAADTGLACTPELAASAPASSSPAPTPSVRVSVTPAVDGRYPAIGRWDATQVANAATIIAVGQRLNVPQRGLVVALATAMQESNLHNLDHGDRDSLGLFQQRPSQGWGSRAQVTDPQYAATAFYRRLLKVDGWQAMRVTQAAQAVQRSGLPTAYAKWEADATMLVTRLAGTAGVPQPCTAVAIGGQGWVKPVDAPIVSGFRTGQRPGHDGVDLGAARGTRIVAASAGTVSRVRCNVGAGSCDVDGHPGLGGCGWYVDITHPAGVITRYCHMLTRPLVREGQTVVAGQQLGVVGSSGNSSGPHLHFEVHRNGDAGSTGAIAPQDWMREHGAPLG